MWLPRGGGVGKDGLGTWDQQIQIFTYRMDRQGFLCSAGDYIQYPAINHNGKGYEQEHTYMYN